MLLLSRSLAALFVLGCSCVTSYELGSARNTHGKLGRLKAKNAGTRFVQGNARPALVQGEVSEASSLRKDYEDLWHGSDSLSREKLSALVQATSSNFKFLKSSAVSASRHRVVSDEMPPLQILGMFDSGTNLMVAYLQANLGKARFQEACPDSSMLEAGAGHCFFWKHASPSALDKLLETGPLSEEGSVLVAMVRSPLSQIASWERSPYDLQQSCLVHAGLQEEEARECVIPNSNHKMAPGPEHFQGASDIWNKYTSAYDALSEKHPDKHVFVVEYESLVMDPEPIVKRIIEAMGYELPEEFEPIDAPAKNHGHLSSRSDAVDRIRGRMYLNESPLGKSTNQLLCSHLDRTPMEMHEVSADPKTTYEGDCNTSGI